jgi:hypothetical protein
VSESERSLKALIEQTASDSGIPEEDEFMDQVRRMFADKGIDLGEDAAPYAQAIRDAFELHSQVRQTEAITQERLKRLDAAFDALSRTWQHVEEELLKLRESLVEREQALKRGSAQAAQGEVREGGKSVEEGAGSFQWSALWPSRVLN